jgi:hypothetical protein
MRWIYVVTSSDRQEVRPGIFRSRQEFFKEYKGYFDSRLAVEAETVREDVRALLDAAELNPGTPIAWSDGDYITAKAAFEHPGEEPAFDTHDINDVNLRDLEREISALRAFEGRLVGVFSEEAGGIIAYAIGDEHAYMIVAALNDAVLNGREAT